MLLSALGLLVTNAPHAGQECYSRPVSARLQA